MSESPNAELRDFLRSRRAKVTPRDAGLPSGPGPRRVPGLRREEVAQLAGLSVDYYVRLERGRAGNVSDSVLDALARALQLNELEHEHLMTLAGATRSGRARPRPAERVRPSLQLVLDSVPHVPAMVHNGRMDVLAGNHLARAVYTDFDALPPRSRNMAWLVFLDDVVRSLYVDWVSSARGIVASLHLYAGRHPDDPALAELVGELSVRDADFRRWWADHDVFQRTHGTKRMHHRLVGELILGYEAFSPVDDPDQVLGISTVEPGSPSEERLRLLASLTLPAAVGKD